MWKRIVSLCIVLSSACLGQSAAPVEYPTRCVEEVVKAETIAVGKQGPFCLSIDGRDPSRKILRTLRKKRLFFKPVSWCNNSPTGPRGVVVYIVMKAHVDQTYDAEVITAEQNVAGGEDLATQLRKGTYHLRNVGGTCQVKYEATE